MMYHEFTSVQCVSIRDGHLVEGLRTWSELKEYGRAARYDMSPFRGISVLALDETPANR